MKWKNLQMPKNVEVDDKVSTNRYGKFSIEPLERGFGVTLGNALRRGRDRRRARLRGRGESARGGSPDRRRAGGFALLARDEGQLRGGEHTHRPADRLRQAYPRDLDRWKRAPVGRSGVRGQDLEGPFRALRALRGRDRGGGQWASG